jgi:N-acetylglucosaminyl-diphospho-decaprenol L-rhamnosyltransferase
MLEKLPAISLIFVNYNSSSYLAKALESIARHEDSACYEIIIVNNDIREKEVIETLGLQHRAKVIQSEGNVGFAKAVNQGVLVATASLVGLLNPDILWMQKQLEQIEVYLGREDSLMGLSLFDGDGKREEYGFGKRVHFWRLIENHLFRVTPAVSGKKQVDWISGGALFFRRETFEKLGGFDGHYFLYYEDVDFCERARQAGYPAYVYEDLKVTHFRGKSQKSPKEQKKAYYQSQKYYFQKMRPWHEQILLRGFHFFLT